MLPVLLPPLEPGVADISDDRGRAIVDDDRGKIANAAVDEPRAVLLHDPADRPLEVSREEGAAGRAASVSRRCGASRGTVRRPFGMGSARARRHSSAGIAPFARSFSRSLF